MGRSQALVLGMQPSPMAGICSKTTPTTISESVRPAGLHMSKLVVIVNGSNGLMQRATAVWNRPALYVLQEGVWGGGCRDLQTLSQDHCSHPLCVQNI